MDTNGYDTEFSALSRLGDVDPDECDDLADVFLGSSSSSPHAREEHCDDLEDDAPEAVFEPRVLQLVIAAHLAEAGTEFEAFCHSESINPTRSVGCVRNIGTGWAASLIGRGHHFNGRRATVAHAVSQVSESADLVNVLLPAHHEVGVLVEGLDDLRDPPDAIIILTSAVESDIVATYRQLKSIAAFSPNQLDRTKIVMLTDEPAAGKAPLSRLIETAARFLDARIPGQIIPRSAESNPPLSESNPPMPMQDSPSSRSVALRPTEAPSEPMDTHTQADPALQATEPHVESVTLQTEPVSPAPEPMPTIDPKTASASSLLCTLTRNMTVLKVRCPSTPQVVLAVDARGQLHAFAATDTIDDLGDETDPVSALIRARAFISRHMPVLAVLDEHIDEHAPPAVGHLVSERFAALEPCLGTEIRLHLVVPVQTSGRRIWAVSELRQDD